MKTFLKIQLLICTLVLMSFNMVSAQEDMKSFHIEMQKTEKGVKLKCTEGCAWTDLSFSLRDGATQMVSEYGMSHSDAGKGGNESLANFQFSIVKTAMHVELVSLSGSAWKKLSFTLDDLDKQVITQMGTSDY